MDEYYVEQIVAKNQTSKDKLIKAGAWVVAGAVLLVGMFIVGSAVMVMLGLAACIAAYFLMPMLNVEYEYLYLEKEL